MYREFKDVLVELRKNSRMTQEELGARLGVVKSTIANYESGYRKPDDEILIKLSNIFDVTVDYLLGVENNTALSYGGSEGKTIRADEFIYALFKEAETLSETEKAAILAMAKFYNEQKNIKK